MSELVLAIIAIIVALILKVILGEKGGATTHCSNCGHQFNPYFQDLDSIEKCPECGAKIIKF